MRYINISNVTPGMILGKNIEEVKSNGKTVVLARAGMSLSNNVINLLQNKDFKGIYIKDSLSDDIDLIETIAEENIRETIKSFKSKNVEEVIDNSKKIAKEIYESRRMNVDLVRMIETTDIEGHSINVCELAVVLAKCDPDFDYRQLSNLSSVALLHDFGKLLSKNDIGKVVLPDALADKANRSGMDVDYFLHPVYAYYYLKRFPTVSAVANKNILFHHEAPDGSGFPAGAKEDQIPELAKIIGVCDRYEHYLCEYGNPIDARIKLAGDYTLKKADRKYIEILLKNVPIFPLTSTVELSTGDQAIVIGYNKSLPERPIIRLVSSGFDANLADPRFMSVTITKLFIGDNVVEFDKNKSSRVRK